MKAKTSKGERQHWKAKLKTLWDINAFSIFSFLLAFQLLLQNRKVVLFTYPPDIIHYSWSVVLVLQLFFPNSLSIFLTSIIGILWYCGNRMPTPSNHVLFMGLMSIAMLSAFLYLLFQQREKHSLNGETLLREVVPTLRIMTIILYFVSAFHKLNSEFFDVNLSCAVLLASRAYDALTLGHFPPLTMPLPIWLSYFLIYGTLIIEFLIALLLSFRKTRVIAVMIGVPLHAIFGVIGYFTFSSIIYAFYFLFLPASFSKVLRGLWQDLKAKFPWLHGGIFPSIILIILAAFFYKGVSPWVKYSTRVWLLEVSVISVLVLVVWYWQPKRENISTYQALSKFQLGHVIFFAALVLTNGLSPYLGFKTTPAFSMFSNLKTEGSFYNHLIIPAKSIQLVDWQDDWVAIRDTSDWKLYLSIQPGVWLTYHSFRAYLNKRVQQRARAFYQYERGGKFITRILPRDQAEFAKKSPWYHRYFVHFRPVRQQGCVG